MKLYVRVEITDAEGRVLGWAVKGVRNDRRKSGESPDEHDMVATAIAAAQIAIPAALNAAT